MWVQSAEMPQEYSRVSSPLENPDTPSWWNLQSDDRFWTVIDIVGDF
jgi:hypothetical protein